jgi:hypothetical protein
MSPLHDGVGKLENLAWEISILFPVIAFLLSDPSVTVKYYFPSRASNFFVTLPYIGIIGQRDDLSPTYFKTRI